MDMNEKTRLQPETADSGRRQLLLRMTTLEKCLLFILLMITIITVSLAVLFASFQASCDSRNVRPLNSSVGDICNKIACVSEAAHLLNSMDPSIYPCDDFYSHVCSNWIKRTYLVSTIDTQFLRISKSLNFRVRDILAHRDGTKKHEKKVKDFYEACINLDEQSEQTADEIKKDIERFGGWPLLDKGWNASKFSWTNLMINFSKNGYIDNMLVHIVTRKDFRNTSAMVLEIGQPSLGLVSRKIFTLPIEDTLNDYMSIIYKIASYLNPKLEKNNTMQEIKEALDIEVRLANLTEEINVRNVQNHYNIMTLKSIEKSAPKVPWRELLQELLPSNISLEANERILVLEPRFLMGLNEILLEMENVEGKKKLANYMFYRALIYLAPHLSESFFRAVFDIGKMRSGEQKKLPDFCADTALSFFHLSLTQSYASEYIDEKARSTLEMMVRDIQKALIEEIEKANWLDEKTKDYALLKVKTLKFAAAYPDEIMNDTILNDYYKNLNINKDHYSNMKSLTVFKQKLHKQGLREKQARYSWSETINLLTANAFYRPDQNSITIPVGLLQETVFDSDRPNYINYGSLGTIIGHEMTHAFDSTGALYDAEGNYRMWWSNSSWQQFQDRAKCFIDQYKKYYEPRADSFIDGKLTLGENIADNGGVQIAYKAYSKLLKRIKSEKKLPGLSRSEKQMFWIAYASVWCRKQTDDVLAMRIKHSPHTPAKFRVIGALSNTKEFAKDFKCDSDVFMNPRTKCSLWG